METWCVSSSESHAAAAGSGLYNAWAIAVFSERCVVYLLHFSVVLFTLSSILISLLSHHPVATCSTPELHIRYSILTNEASMGKGGRIACILTPWLLTIASFICILLIEISGWNKSILPGYYFMKVNFTDLDVSGASGLANTTTLTAALKEVQGDLADIYEIHLWLVALTFNSSAKQASLLLRNETYAEMYPI